MVRGAVADINCVELLGRRLKPVFFWPRRGAEAPLYRAGL